MATGNARRGEVTSGDARIVARNRGENYWPARGGGDTIVPMYLRHWPLNALTITTPALELRLPRVAVDATGP